MSFILKGRDVSNIEDEKIKNRSGVTLNTDADCNELPFRKYEFDTVDTETQKSCHIESLSIEPQEDSVRRGKEYKDAYDITLDYGESAEETIRSIAGMEKLRGVNFNFSNIPGRYSLTAIVTFDEMNSIISALADPPDDMKSAITRNDAIIIMWVEQLLSDRQQAQGSERSGR